MDARGYRLGVDFGTSSTVAMLARPDGQVRPLLFDGSPTLPSAVYADPQAGLLVGRDATHAARVSPERYEPNPKRRIDESAVLLGDAEVATADLIAAVLARVGGEARRVTGGALGPATVTCPAAWAQTRRGVLLAAAERAGLGRVTLVPEPVSAAQVFLTVGGPDAARPGSAFVVYDLGAGTFDASVVRNAGGAFEVLATEGLNTSGGLDIDAAIVGYLGAILAGRDAGAWRRLTHPESSPDRRAHRLLWDDVRAAKEMLSRTSATMIHVPGFDDDVPLTRDQFEQLARPILAATVTSTRAALAAAGLSAADVEGVFLVGGGSRIPLVATLLHQALGKAPTVVEQPELVVAQGAVGASAQFTLLSPGGAPAAGGASTGGYGTPAARWAAAADSGAFVHGSPFTASVPHEPVSGAATPSPAAVSGPGAFGAVSGPPAFGAVSAPPAFGPVSAPPVGGEVSGPRGLGAVSGPPAAGAVSGPPAARAVSGPPVAGMVSGPPAAPVSGMPGFRSSMSAAPVSPGFSAAPVTGYPGSPGGAVPPLAPPAGTMPPGATAGGAVPPSAAALVGAPQRGVTGAPVGGGAGQRRRAGVLALVAVVVLLVAGIGAYGISRAGIFGGTNGGDGGGNSGGGTGHGDTPVAAEVEQTGADWTTTAEAYDGKPGTTVGYNCPAGGTIGTVWGSGPYTTDSSVCTSAVHAGKITLADGGRVVIKIRQGASSYEGTTQHDIVTTAYDAYPWAFDIVS